MDKEIDRPLGRQLPAPPAMRRGGTQAWAGNVLPLAIAAVVLVSGIYVALLDDGFRHPGSGVTVVPAEAPAEIAAAPDATPAADTSPPLADKPGPAPSEGPSVVTVQPPSGNTGNVIVIRDPSAVGQDLRVAHLPDRALLEQSETGPLPIVAADGRRAVDVYARPWSGSRGAKVAIVIGGLGLSQTGTQAAIAALPAEVTLAFAPQGNSIGRWMQTARQKGHEIMMQVPLEPFDYPRVNPGRNTLTTQATPEQNLDHLRWVMSRTTNYVGVLNYMGARFTAEASAMAPVMEELGRRGLLYMDDGTSARSAAPDLAAQSRVPFAQGDLVIDTVQDRGQILKKLDELEATARAKGSALGSGSAFDVTVDAVVSWIREARKRGIEIVPVTALASKAE